MKKVFIAVICVILTVSLCGCNLLFPTDEVSNSNGGSNKSKKDKTYSVSVHYYNENTRSYTATIDDRYIQCDFLAPAGQMITGIFDQNGTQYADYDCKIDLMLYSDIPIDLYARYADVDISYLDNDPFTALDENPKPVSFYAANVFTWEFDPKTYSDDKKMVAACLCNPYADLKITVSFMGKGDGSKKYGDNDFFSNLKVCGETVASFTEVTLGESYSLYTYSATIKAKQLTNGNYEVKVSYSSRLGYEDFVVKNFRVDFAFDFDSNN